MRRGLFRISVSGPKRSRKLMVYYDSFQVRRETYVVHRTPRSIRWFFGGYRVSHKQTGFRVLADRYVAGRQIWGDYDTPREAKEAAMWVLTHRTNEQVAEAVGKAEEINRA